MISGSTEKLKIYLNKVKELAEKLDLEKVVYVEGTNVGQITYHTFQSANFWLRVNILGEEFPRNRDAEFNETHTLEEIFKSFDLALEAISNLEGRAFSLDDKLPKPVEISYDNIICDTVGLALIYSTSHTAEHYGELTTQKYIYRKS